MNSTKKCNYNPQLEERFKSDASLSGLEANLEHLTVDG